LADDGGLSRIQQRMAMIPKRVREAVKPSIEKAADEIVALAISLCPVDKGALRDSIEWTWGTAPAGSLALAMGSGGDLTITVYAGNDEVFHARWVEFGTASGMFGGRIATEAVGKRGRKKKGRKIYRSHPGTTAQPFFFPAYRLGKKQAATRIKRAISKAVRENWGKR
jgi:HK97 gp10 family phage protein